MSSALPSNYRIILDVVTSLGPGSHVTADVYAQAKVSQPHIGFTTVHRGLARLHELGYILKLDVPGATSAIYEPAASPHAHFRCTACGHIDDIDFTVAPADLAALGSRHGVRIAAESVTFTGRCATCAESSP
jgi:Fur family ferric uptake transcriptional regulator